MKCHVCDKTLTEAEIQVDPTGRFEPCAPCMEIVLDAAYCDGFVRPDEMTDESPFGDGSVETLDPDTHYSLLNSDDIGFQDDRNIDP